MLFIGFGNTILIVISHLQIERNPRDGCRYLDTLCPKEELIVFQCLDYLPSYTLPLVFRQHKES